HVRVEAACLGAAGRGRLGKGIHARGLGLGWLAGLWLTWYGARPRLTSRPRERRGAARRVSRRSHRGTGRTLLCVNRTTCQNQTQTETAGPSFPPHGLLRELRRIPNDAWRILPLASGYSAVIGKGNRLGIGSICR